VVIGRIENIRLIANEIKNCYFLGPQDV